VDAGTTLDLVLGLINVLVPVFLVSATLVLVVRLAGKGELHRGILYIVFLPSRQRTLVRLFALTVLFFLVGGVVDGFTLLNWLPEAVSDLSISISDAGAAVALFLLLVRGLAPRTLTHEERTSLSQNASAMAALGIAGFAAGGEGEFP
jgi:hypothetical protein